MSFRRRHAVFALVPALVVLLLIEGGARLLIRSDGFRMWVAGPYLLEGVAGTHNMLYRPGRNTVADPYNGYRLKDATKPDSHRPPYLPQPPKEENEIRILCVGDSTTYGIYLNNRQTWPAQLQAALNDGAPNTTRFTVYNGGVPGYWSQQCKRLIQSRYMELQPDLVLWREEPACSDRVELPPVSSMTWFRARQLLYRSRAIYLAVSMRRIRESQTAQPFYGPVNIFNAVPQWEQDYTADVLPEFAAWLKERGVRELVGVEYLFYLKHPLGEGIGEFYRSDGRHDMLKGNASQWQRRDIPFVSCLEEMVDGEGAPDANFADYCHLTPEGAAVVGRTVAAYLRREFAWARPSTGTRAEAPAARTAR